MERREQNKFAWKLVILALVVGLLAGLMGGVISAQIFAKTGPQGEQGPEGEQGPQGLQGIPGVDGTDSILQIIQNSNDTQVAVSGYQEMQWYNMSDFDSSMEITVNVQQDSKIFAQFSSTNQLEPPASIWVRIAVDNDNSTVYKCSVGPPASGTYTMTGHIEFLSSSLSSGPHTVNVQFWIEDEPLNVRILDRTLTALEIASQ